MSYFGKTESLDFFGNGILHMDGKCCFIKDALPTEEIRFELTEEKKKFAKGYSVEICRRSPYRTAPSCPYYGSCGGCDFQHVDYSQEKAAKENHVLRALKQIGGLRDFRFLPLEEPEKLYGYRNHVTFHMRNGKTCFYREKTHDHIEIDHCDLLEPKLNEALKQINAMALKDATSVVLRCDNTGHLIAAIYGTKVKDFSAFVGENKLFSGIIVINEQGSRVFGDEMLCFDLDGLRFRATFRSFFQIHTEAALNMLRYCRVLLEGEHIENLLDLYCGVGSIGQYLGSRKTRVYGIEIVKDAVKIAKENAKNNGIESKYIIGKTEDHLKNLLKKIPHADTVILDPPRQGLQKNTAAVLNHYGAERILYISCDPASLSRDLKELSQKYRVLSAKPFDFFPRTAHVECVVLLTKAHK